MDLVHDNSVGLSCSLLKHVLQALRGVSVRSHFVFDPEKGLSCHVLDTHQQTLLELQLSTLSFEWYNVGKRIEMPLYFHRWLEFVDRVKPADNFVVQIWPLSCQVQAFDLENKIRTDLLDLGQRPNAPTFAPRNYNHDLFPALNQQNLSHLVSMSQVELVRQNAFGFIDPELIHVSIYDNTISFYSENDGRASSVHSVRRFYWSNERDVDELRRFFCFQISKDASDVEIQPSPMVHTETRCLGKILTHAHMMRCLSTLMVRPQKLSKKKQRNRSTIQDPSSMNVLIALAQSGELVAHYPLHGYGCSALDRERIDVTDQSFLRYRIRTPGRDMTKRTPQPITQHMEEEFQRLESFKANPPQKRKEIDTTKIEQPANKRARKTKARKG